MTEFLEWHEANVKLEDLKSYDKNPRYISDKELERLKESIKDYGYHQRILVDYDNTIIGGHQRVTALKALNYTPEHEIKVLKPTRKLTRVEFKKLNVIDNTDFGDFDVDMLLNDFSVDDLLDLGVDESLLALDAAEDENPEVDESLDDTTPEPPLDPTTKLGDIYKMGEHLLICGDSTDINIVEQVLPNKANMIFTDPPYLMDFKGSMTTTKEGKATMSFSSKYKSIENDKMTKEDGEGFLNSINYIIKEKVKGDFYITFYRFGIQQYWQSLESLKLKVRALIIWYKNNHNLSDSNYKSKYEPMFYGWVDSTSFKGSKGEFDVWEIDRTKKNDLHPTMKPVKLVERAIKNSSNIGDTVLDLFGGSGTTLVCCEQLKRKARIVELEPSYCDVIVKRWEDLTNNKAELINASRDNST